MTLRCSPSTTKACAPWTPSPCYGGLWPRRPPDQAPQPSTGLDALSRPTLGFPADVMRGASVVSGVYGAQLPGIGAPRTQAVRHTTTVA